LSARKRPSLALLDGCYRVVVELAGDTRGRRFLTASSKASQSTSGRWCGRQGEQSPHVSGDVIFCCYSPLPGKSWGWYSKEGSSVFPQARKVRMVGKNGRMEGKSLLSSTAQGPPNSLERQAWKWQWLGAVRKCGRRDSKSAWLAKRPKIASTDNVTACRWSAAPKNRK
jgi:hypothetical protein